MANENLGTQIAGGEFNSSTRVFEKVVHESCGCSSYEWTILTGLTGVTVVRQRFCVPESCAQEHNLRSKVMKTRSSR